MYDSSYALHVNPRRASLMVSSLTEKIRPNSALLFVDFLISNTRSQFSFAAAALSCLAFLPFLSMSSTFSLRVPKNKCAGLTHDLTSHLWQTKRPSGILP